MIDQVSAFAATISMLAASDWRRVAKPEVFSIERWRRSRRSGGMVRMLLICYSHNNSELPRAAEKAARRCAEKESLISRPAVMERPVQLAMLVGEGLECAHESVVILVAQG